MDGIQPATRNSKLGILAISVVLAIILGVSGCRQSKPTVSPKPAPKPAAQPSGEKTPPATEKQTAEIQAAQISWPDAKGRPLWKAKFKKGSYSHSGNESVAELQGVEAEMYNDGKLVSSLTAQRVVADSRTKVVTAYVGVKVVSHANGAVAKSDKLTWKASEQKIYGVGNVSVVQDNVTITSNRVVSDTGLKHVVFSD